MTLAARIEAAKIELNRTPFAAYDLYITRMQEYRRLKALAA